MPDLVNIQSTAPSAGPGARPDFTSGDYSLRDTIELTAADLYVRALKGLPEDVKVALRSARDSEVEPTPRRIMETICRNVDLAGERSMLVCQDTGLVVYLVNVGEEFPLKGLRLEEALKKGAERATAEHPLRSSSTHPLTRQQTPTNSGERLPVTHYHIVPGADTLEITCIPKGSGSENMSYLKMLTPAAGVEGVKRFIVECITESGANPCPPIIVGIGLGGTADLCMQLAKEAIARPCGQPHPDPLIAGFERDMLESINALGIGPQGLGGKTTALSVAAEFAHTHITMNPVAVNIQCWAARRATARIHPDRRVEDIV